MTTQNNRSIPQVPPKRLELGFPGGALPGGTHLRAQKALDVDGDDKQPGKQDTGQKAGHEKLADGLLGQDAVDDKTDTRRDQYTQGPAGCHAAGREPRVVFVFVHFGNRHHTHCGARCQRRPAYCCKTGTGHDCRHSQSAPEMPHPGIYGLVDVRTDAGNKGKLAHEHKQRNDAQGVGGTLGQRCDAQNVDTGFRTDQNAQAQKSDQGHGHADVHPHGKQNDQTGDSGQSDNLRAQEISSPWLKKIN